MPEKKILYRKLDKPDIAYMVKDGKVRCQLTNDDFFDLDCKNVIVGGGEILVGLEQGFEETRHVTMTYLPNNSDNQKNIIKLKPKQIIGGVNTFKVAFHTARFIAMCLKRINAVRTKKNEQLKLSDELLKSYSIIFAKALNRLEDAYQQYAYPWIEKLVNEESESLIYQKGKAFVRLENRKPVELDSDKLDKYNVKFPRGSFICKQGDKGTELYKLVKGRLKVIVNGNEVTDIEQGCVVGEMALLLGETRTATLKATEDCIVTVISKENLPNIVEEDKNFFKNIIISLSRWELISVNLVEELYDIIKNSSEENNEHNDIKKILEYKEILKDLRKKINHLYSKYEQQFLFEISADLTHDLRELDKKYKEKA
jgi:hypothetical protein